MNILRMHIRLQQQLRQIASNTLGELESSELDDYLTQAEQLYLDRIVDLRNNKLQIGFEQSYQRFAQVGIEPTTIIRQLKSVSSDVMIGSLPTFLHSPTRIDVSTEPCKATYKTVSYKIAIIPFNVPHTLNDFSNFSITVGSTSIEPQGRENYTNPENTNSFIRLLHNLKFEGVELYWESTDVLYQPNCLIIKIPTSNQAGNAVVVFDVNNTKTVTFETTSYSVSALNTDGVFRGCRIAQQEDIADMLVDPFQTTKHDSPLVEIQGKYVYVHHNSKFVPKLLRIGYIPIPAPVSLNLNISSQMPERTHEAIVSVAAELIQADMMSIQKQPEERS